MKQSMYRDVNPYVSDKRYKIDTVDKIEHDLSGNENAGKQPQMWYKRVNRLKRKKK